MARPFSRVALLALSVSAWCLSAAPTRVLFPTNLHLTRQVQDPLSDSVVTIDEYCSGNRMVAISGDRTVIVDYDKQEITEIDRRAGTYSVTRFAEVASAITETGNVASVRTMSADGSAPKDRWKVTPLGVRGSPSGKSLEQFEFVDAGEFRRKVDVGIDRSVSLTRDAVEVLMGAAYPNAARDEHEPVLRAAASARAEGRPIATNDAGAKSEDKTTYGLPVTQTFSYTDSGSEITFRSTITRVGAETVPAEALMIPPAAKRVESPSAAVRRQLRELDHPGSTTTPREN